MAGTRPLRRDAQRNRERIIEAAHEVFALRGFAATLDDVAHQAGVGIGTVYRRFPTKEALVEAAFADRLQDVVELAELACATPSAWDGFVTFLLRSARMHAADRGLRDAVLSLGRHRFIQVEERLIGLLGQMIDRAKAEGTLRPDVADTDIPVILAMVSQVAHACSGTPPETHERYLRLLIDGLRAGPDNSPLGLPLSHADVTSVMSGCVPRL